MKSRLIVAQMLWLISICGAQSGIPKTRKAAEYYVAVYAQHYRVPLAFVRSIIERESNWQPCVVSPAGAVGLMQLMPETARRLGVTDRCNLDENISGGVRYLAWLIQRFHRDLRLVAAAYYAGENRVGNRGLSYANSDVVAYVSRIRKAYGYESEFQHELGSIPEKRDVR